MSVLAFDLIPKWILYFSIVHFQKRYIVSELRPDVWSAQNAFIALIHHLLFVPCLNLTGQTRSCLSSCPETSSARPSMAFYEIFILLPSSQETRSGDFRTFARVTFNYLFVSNFLPPAIVPYLCQSLRGWWTWPRFCLSEVKTCGLWKCLWIAEVISRKLMQGEIWHFWYFLYFYNFQILENSDYGNLGETLVDQSSLDVNQSCSSHGVVCVGLS